MKYLKKCLSPTDHPGPKSFYLLFDEKSLASQ